MTSTGSPQRAGVFPTGSQDVRAEGAGQFFVWCNIKSRKSRLEKCALGKVRTLRLLVLPADYFDFAWAGLTTVWPAVEAMDAGQTLLLLETLPDDSVAASSSEDEFVEPDNPVEIFILTTTATMTWRVKAAPARVTWMSQTTTVSLRWMPLWWKGRGRERERGFGRGIGRRHGRGRVHRYYVQPAVQPALVDICNTWDNADTPVTGNTPAFHQRTNLVSTYLREPLQCKDLIYCTLQQFARSAINPNNY